MNCRTYNEDSNQESQESKQEKAEVDEKSVSVVPSNAKHKVHYLTIIGQIEGHVALPPQNKTTKYEYVIPQLITVEEDIAIEGLMVILNTVGGDVEAGLAIAEMIANISKPTVSLVLGGGHSIGVPLAVAADYSFVAPSATMTIHPIRINGTMIGASQTYEYFNRVQEQIISFIVKHSKVSAEHFRNLMLSTGNLANDIGTILYGDEAVKAGIIDDVGGISIAIKKIYSMIEKNKKNQK